MLESPQRNEKDIRELSNFIYLISSHYRRLVDYYSTILLYNYTIVPTKIPVSPTKSTFKKEYYEVANICEKYNMKREAAQAIKIAIRDGIYCGLYYETNDSFYIKPIDAKNTKISSIEDGTFMFSMDMSYFSGREYLLDVYGPDFKRSYEAYKGNSQNGTSSDKKKKWYEPPNGICIKADETDPIYSLPLFTGLLLSVFDIEDYKLLQKAKTENDNYKVLSAKMDTDSEGIPLMEYPIAEKYYNQMSQNLAEGIGLLLSPFEMKDFSFQKNTSSDRNTVSDAEDQFWYDAGVSSLIFGSSKATSSSSLKLSVKPDESLALSLLYQFEMAINKKIKKMDFTYGFKIKFTPQSIFNADELSDRLLKACQYGVDVKLQYAASLGMSPSDVLGMSYLEQDILGLGTKRWKHPLVSSNTQSSSVSDGGRPTAEGNGTQLGDAGEATRNSDGNDR